MQKPASQGDVARLSPLFLTGGSGYVGRNLIRHFTSQGIEVRALARSAAAAETVKALGAQPCRGDLLDANLASLMASCRSLVHAAADTRHGHANKDQLDTNIGGTARLFEAARDCGIGRAVHISTESVLLDGGPLVNATEQRPLPRRFPGTYSRSKAQAEAVALESASKAFSVVAVRPRFVWGRDDTTALPILAAAARSGQMAWINGGHYLTSTTHIANLCHGIERALQLGESGQVYFITDDRPMPFREFVSRLLATQGIEAPQKSVPRWFVKSIATAGDVLASISRGKIRLPVTRQDLATMAVEITLDNSKARHDLGYASVIGIDEGMLELQAAAAANAAAHER